MKNLKNYLIFNQNAKGNIQEGLITRKVSTKAPARYKPETKEELRDIIIDLLNKGITDLNCIDVSDIDDMTWLFANVNHELSVKEIDISEWNVSKVTNMEGMFDGCKEFNANLSKWNVSNVTNMDCMFYNCYKFNCDLSNWDVSNVINMKEIFSTCKNFNSDLSKWNVSNVKDMADMFWGCEFFNADLSKWDVSNVTDMSRMFKDCIKFNSDLSKWNINNDVDMKYMFGGCVMLKKNNKIPAWYNGKL